MGAGELLAALKTDHAVAGLRGVRGADAKPAASPYAPPSLAVIRGFGDHLARLAVAEGQRYRPALRASGRASD